MTPRDHIDEDPSAQSEDRVEEVRERIASRSPDAVADALNSLLDNPVFNQALKAAFGARDLATDASNQALRNLNIGTAADLDRLTRRLRSVSNRLESLEDAVDGLERELSGVRSKDRRRHDPDPQPEPESSGGLQRSRDLSPEELARERLGLSE